MSQESPKDVQAPTEQLRQSSTDFTASSNKLLAEITPPMPKTGPQAGQSNDSIQSGLKAESTSGSRGKDPENAAAGKGSSHGSDAGHSESALRKELAGLESKQKDGSLSSADTKSAAGHLKNAINGIYKHDGPDGVADFLKKLSLNGMDVSASSATVQDKNNPKYEDIKYDITLKQAGEKPIDLQLDPINKAWKHDVADRPLPPQVEKSLANANVTAADFKKQISNFDQVDLSNVKNADGKTLYRGGAPTLEGLQYLKDLGVKRIVDFRKPSDKEGVPIEQEKAFCKQNGMDYVNIPITTSKGPTSADVKNYLDTMLNGDKETTYEHCEHGRDRTGGMTALLSVLDNKGDSEKAIADMRAHGISDTDKAGYPNFPRYDDMIKAVNGAQTKEDLVKSLDKWFDQHKKVATDSQSTVYGSAQNELLKSGFPQIQLLDA